jgi:serine phosphatase RsbU (regulator of sigma subunit)
MHLAQTGLTAADRTPLRAELNQLPGLDLHAQYQSKRMGGDFFDAVVIGSRMLFMLTDIAGRRPRTHTIASEVQDTFRTRSLSIFGARDTNLMDATAELIQEVNRKLISAAQGVCFAPTFLGCFDLTLGVLAYINAGGQPAVFHDSDGTRLLPNVDVPMGLFTHLIYEPSIQAFEEGARLLVVTKGVVESQHRPTHFGVERVIRSVQNSTALSATEICRATLQEAANLRKLPWYSTQNLLYGKRQKDEDLTALAMVRRPPGSRA